MDTINHLTRDPYILFLLLLGSIFVSSWKKLVGAGFLTFSPLFHFSNRWKHYLFYDAYVGMVRFFQIVHGKILKLLFLTLVIVYSISFTFTFDRIVKDGSPLSADNIDAIWPVVRHFMKMENQTIVIPNRHPEYWMIDVFTNNRVINCDHFSRPVEKREACEFYDNLTGPIPIDTPYDFALYQPDRDKYWINKVSRPIKDPYTSDDPGISEI